MKYAIGIDLGGTFIKYAIISEAGNIEFDGNIPSCSDISAEAVIGQILKAIEYCNVFAKEHQINISGVGLGTPGITDKTNRIIIGGSDNIEGWSNINLADIIEKEYNLPTQISNDANLMGLGEQAYGAAKGCSDVLFITVGTGIGGAIIIDSKLFGGFNNRGTELGHIPFILDGEPCSCGSVGCWETYASTTAMVNRFEKRAKESGLTFNEDINGKLITRLYNENHPLALETIEEECRYLGRGIGSLINIFSPQKVVVGGGISEAGDFFIEKVAHYSKVYAMPDCAVNTDICKAQLGNKAGCMGAVQLIFAFN